MVSQRYFLIGVLLLSALTLGSAGCDKGERSNVNEEIRELRSEMRSLSQLRHDVRSLKSDLAAVRARLKTPGPQSAAIAPRNWKPDGSHRDDPFLGEKDAPVVVMAFGDFQCQPCRKFYESSYRKLIKEFVESDTVQFIFRDFPLSKNEHAVPAAIMAHCAGEQGKYWELFDLLFENQKLLAEGLLSSIEEKAKDLDRVKFAICRDNSVYRREIAADIEEGKRLGVKGAPSFFIGKRLEEGRFSGVFVRGAQPYGVLRSEILKLSRDGETG